MELLLAAVIGILYTVGIYLVLRRSIVKLILGIAVLGYGANLLIFTVARINRDGVPIIPSDEKVLTGSFADPLPQALILTAIVIGFAVLAFILSLMREASATLETGDVELLSIAVEEDE